MAQQKQRPLVQKVLRKTLAGGWNAFTFNVSAESFFVKNFSDDFILVSFAQNVPDENCWKILSLAGEEIFYNNVSGYTTDTVYVKGTGEVEVQALDF